MDEENPSDHENETSQDSQVSQTQGKRKTHVTYYSQDRSLEQYIYDEFKTKSIYAKDLPFEAIDVNLYKPKAMLTAFKTTDINVDKGHYYTVL